MNRTIAIASDEHEAPAEARLWKAVLAHTIREWISGPLRRQREADRFIFHEDSDFWLVCGAAGMDAESLRKRLTRLRKESATTAVCQVAA